MKKFRLATLLSTVLAMCAIPSFALQINPALCDPNGQAQALGAYTGFVRVNGQMQLGFGTAIPQNYDTCVRVGGVIPISSPGSTTGIKVNPSSTIPVVQLDINYKYGYGYNQNLYPVMAISYTTPSGSHYTTQNYWYWTYYVKPTRVNAIDWRYKLLAGDIYGLFGVPYGSTINAVAIYDDAYYYNSGFNFLVTNVLVGGVPALPNLRSSVVTDCADMPSYNSSCSQ